MALKNVRQPNSFWQSFDFFGFQHIQMPIEVQQFYLDFWQLMLFLFYLKMSNYVQTKLMRSNT